MVDLTPLSQLGATGVLLGVLIWFTNKQQERSDKQYQAMLDWNKQQSEFAQRMLESVQTSLANTTAALLKVSERL